MRAFRPSQFGRNDEVDEEAEQVKLENVQLYAQRARAGLPLFEAVRQAQERELFSAKHVR